MAPEKFYHVANGVVLEWKIPIIAERTQRFLKNANRKNGLSYVSLAAIQKSYSLDYLIDAVKQLPEENVAVVFIGNGIYKEELEQRAQDSENVFYFLPLISSKVSIVIILMRYMLQIIICSDSEFV